MLFSAKTGVNTYFDSEAVLACTALRNLPADKRIFEV